MPTADGAGSMMTWEFASDVRMWYVRSRGRFTRYILLVATPDGHEYRPHVPTHQPEPRSQWVQLEPCQTLAEAKRAALEAASNG